MAVLFIRRPVASLTKILGSKTTATIFQCNMCFVHRLSSTAETGLAKIFEMRANVKKDILVYEFINPKFFQMMKIFGVAQCGFWFYLTGFTYINLKEVSIEDGHKLLSYDADSIPWWRKINLGGNLYRNGLSSLCMILGITVLGITIIYPSRAIKSLHLLKGGSEIRLKTYSVFKNTADFTVPLNSVSCVQARTEQKPQIAMKIQNRWLYFMLDKRGLFHHKDLFDFVVGLKRQV